MIIVYHTSLDLVSEYMASYNYQQSNKELTVNHIIVMLHPFSVVLQSFSRKKITHCQCNCNV